MLLNRNRTDEINTGLYGPHCSFVYGLRQFRGFDLGIKNAAKLHTIASTPAFDLPIDSVCYVYEDYILETPLEIEDGRMMVPDEPGLAAVDEAKVEQFRID